MYDLTKILTQTLINLVLTLPLSLFCIRYDKLNARRIRIISPKLLEHICGEFSMDWRTLAWSNPSPSGSICLSLQGDEALRLKH